MTLDFYQDKCQWRLNIETGEGVGINQGSNFLERFFSARDSQCLKTFWVFTSGLGQLLLRF